MIVSQKPPTTSTPSASGVTSMSSGGSETTFTGGLEGAPRGGSGGRPAPAGAPKRCEREGGKAGALARALGAGRGAAGRGAAGPRAVGWEAAGSSGWAGSSGSSGSSGWAAVGSGTAGSEARDAGTRAAGERRAGGSSVQSKSSKKAAASARRSTGSSISSSSGSSGPTAAGLRGRGAGDVPAWGGLALLGGAVAGADGRGSSRLSSECSVVRAAAGGAPKCISVRCRGRSGGRSVWGGMLASGARRAPDPDQLGSSDRGGGTCALGRWRGACGRGAVGISVGRRLEASLPPRAVAWSAAPSATTSSG